MSGCLSHFLMRLGCVISEPDLSNTNGPVKNIHLERGKTEFAMLVLTVK
jgi:hypothetical protein